MVPLRRASLRATLPEDVGCHPLFPDCVVCGSDSPQLRAEATVLPCGACQRQRMLGAQILTARSAMPYLPFVRNQRELAERPQQATGCDLTQATARRDILDRAGSASKRPSSTDVAMVACAKTQPCPRESAANARCAARGAKLYEGDTGLVDYLLTRRRSARPWLVRCRRALPQQSAVWQQVPAMSMCIQPSSSRPREAFVKDIEIKEPATTAYASAVSINVRRASVFP